MTAWFELNEMDVFAKNINYVNIPQYYVFNNQNKAWMRRQRNQQFNTIRRKSNVSTKGTKKFYLKLLLYKIKGGTSFKDLHTVNNTKHVKKQLWLWDL